MNRLIGMFVLLLVAFGIGFSSSNWLNEERFNSLKEEQFTAYKTSRLGNVYSKIIYDASYYGVVQPETVDMINNYKIEFGSDIPKINVSVVGGN